ncbi:7108_t:CDS:2 [Ambispora gerdemannii]|uniref:7108_t:CDS:1 n=1 Tax=Ambispora gerdemannii TaxID=144530 RepID=A0A9N9B4F4_9GLOM|nr:7108_t:CDS:2 [Ambispora gerdemannii]
MPKGNKKRNSKPKEENQQQKAKEANQVQTSAAKKTLRRLRNEQQIERLTLKVPHGISATLNLHKAINTTKEKVKRIAKECRRLNIKFLDREFDVSDFEPCLYNLHEVDYSGVNDTKRVNKLYKEPKFYADGVSPGDVRQGIIGDCWFLSAVSTCTNIKGVIETICVARDEQVGVYGFIFFKDGDWVSTVVDDQLFVSTIGGSSVIAVAQCKDPNETWLPLLEKAYAKIHGDYESIDGGSVSDALEDFTGGVSTLYATSELLDIDRLWREDFLNVNKTVLFGCGRAGLGDASGIIDGHAYSVLDATEYQGVKLVKVRNPWGNVEWSGAWSDGSETWTPESMATLKHRFGDDGIFWISYADFLDFFNYLFKCRIFDDSWNVYSTWINYNVEPKSDGRFNLKLSKKAKVIIVLQQPDRRYLHEPPAYLYQLAFRVVEEGSSTYLIRSPYTKTLDPCERNINLEIELEAGSYEIIPRIEAFPNPYAEISKQPNETQPAQDLPGQVDLDQTEDENVNPESTTVTTETTESPTQIVYSAKLAMKKDKFASKLSWDLKLGIRVYTQSDGVSVEAYEGPYPVSKDKNLLEEEDQDPEAETTITD